MQQARSVRYIRSAYQYYMITGMCSMCNSDTMCRLMSPIAVKQQSPKQSWWYRRHLSEFSNMLQGCVLCPAQGIKPLNGIVR